MIFVIPGKTHTDQQNQNNCQKKQCNVGAEVFPSGKTPLDALYISFFMMGFTNYSLKPGYGQPVVTAQLVSGVL